MKTLLRIKKNNIITLLLMLFTVVVSAQVDTEVQNLKMESFIYGGWRTDSHFLMVDNDEKIWLDINRSCAVKFPIRVIDSISFEIIWDNDIDCVYELDLQGDFGLQKVPIIGKPYAKYTLSGDKIYVTYYYPEWAKAFSESGFLDISVTEYTKLED